MGDTIRMEGESNEGKDKANLDSGSLWMEDVSRDEQRRIRREYATYVNSNIWTEDKCRPKR